MKLTTTIKNFKNNIIGYFSSSKSNGDDNEGLYVVPASLLNNNKSILGFSWAHFVKAEFVTKKYQNLLSLCKGNQYDAGGKINIYLKLGSNTLNINDGGIYSAISIDINKSVRNLVEVQDDNGIIKANDLITRFIKANTFIESIDFSFKPQNGSNVNTTDDISRFLSCINIYYIP